MSDTLITLGDSSNWAYRGAKSKIARTTRVDRQTKQLPIPKFDLGFSLNAKFLAVAVLVRQAKPTWNAGGFIQQFYPTSLKPKTAPVGLAVAKSQFLLINRTNLISFPRLSGKSYRLIYAPPFWFLDVRIQIWQYRGIEANFTEEKLRVIEQKINQLL